jgi:hypothetical protein
MAKVKTSGVEGDYRWRHESKQVPAWTEGT